MRSREASEMADQLLRMEGVHKSYGDEHVLRGVDLDLERKEVEVIAGPSGSGKSTLLRCINRLTEIDAGTIYLDGEPISTPETDVNALRRRIGMVFQDINLFRHLTARGNVALGLRRVVGLSEADANRRAEDHLDRVGLAEQVDSYPAELSGGQKQRVGIARALALEPELMLFDEPTSSLDPELVAEVLGVMRDLADEGMTMLTVTHEMGFARRVADRMSLMDEGRIVERGPPEQLFERPQHERTRQFLGMLDDRVP